MAKLTRYLQKIFANNSNQVGVFGTGTDKETSKNVETLQSADYENGWSAAIITNKNYPIWQEMDGVQYGLSYQIKYLQQSGIPEWLSTETYYTNDYCRYGNDIYYSLQDDNTNHNPALNDGWWKEFLSDKADTDLSNLTATGKTKVVTLAHELDWDNAITVSTTSQITPHQTYTPTSDGMMFLYSAINGGSGNKSCSSYFYFNNLDYGIGSNTTSASFVASLSKPCLKNENVEFSLYATGGATLNACKAVFVPFKKS